MLLDALTPDSKTAEEMVKYCNQHIGPDWLPFQELDPGLCDDIRTELNKFRDHAASAIGHGAGTTDGDETLRFQDSDSHVHVNTAFMKQTRLRRSKLLVPEALRHQNLENQTLPSTNDRMLLPLLYFLPIVESCTNEVAYVKREQLNAEKESGLKARAMSRSRVASLPRRPGNRPRRSWRPSPRHSDAWNA